MPEGAAGRPYTDTVSDPSLPGDSTPDEAQGTLFPPPEGDRASESSNRGFRNLFVAGFSALALVVGGFVLWMQVGLTASLASVVAGGADLQGNLSQAADALAAGDYAEGLRTYEEAELSTVRIEEALDTPQIDLIGRLQGFATATDNLMRLSAAASDISEATGELLTLYGDLSGQAGTSRIFTDGAIDLQRLEAIPPRVVAAQEQLLDAEVQLTAIEADTRPSQMLDELRKTALAEMQSVLAAVNTLDTIAPFLPDALGANDVRRYLLAIGNQAEMRAAGGAPLTLLLVEFDNGRISIPVKGQTSTQLFPPLNAPVDWFGPAYNPFFVGNQRTRPFVVANTHPNMLFSGQEMARAWEGGGYPGVDGVVTLDITAIAAVLEATGPVESAAYGTVDASQIGEILLIDAYSEFGQDQAVARQQANQDLLDTLLTRLLGGDDLVNAAQAIASTAPGRHFQVWMRDGRLEQLAIESGAAGVVDDPEVGDWSALYTQNGNQSKVDVFQQRNVLVTVNLAEDGSARVTQQLTLTNATPADRPEGPPERVGYETSWLKNAYVMYVPDAARNYRASYPIDFAVRPFKGHSRRQLGSGWIDDGFGHTMIRIVGWTPPGGQTAVSVSYELPPGTFSTDNPNALEYNLRAEPQSLFLDSLLTVTVTPPTGWGVVEIPGMQVTDGSGTVSAVQSGPVDVRMSFRR